ncbi:cellulose binding domain-containing protein [Streptomyces nogalater]
MDRPARGADGPRHGRHGPGRSRCRTLGAAAASPGCGKAPTLTSGTYTIQSSGKNRSFILKMPDGYDPGRAYRLVFGFHWLGGTSTDVATGRTVDTGTWAYYGLQRLADNSAVFVAPRVSTTAGPTPEEDITFVDDMIRRIEADLCVDQTQRFALGFSYGAAMSYSLACSRATVFRAVAVQSGGVLSGCGDGTRPIAYLGVHGLRDSVLGISGGRAMRDRFVRNNGCTPQNPPGGPGQPDPPGHRLLGLLGRAPGRLGRVRRRAHRRSAGRGPGRQRLQDLAAARDMDVLHTVPDVHPAGTTACQVGGTVNAWNTGLTASLTVTNTGTTAIDGWSLAFTLPEGQTITSGWNADYSPASGRVTARNVSHNATIAPGASVAIGFQATHSGNTAAPGSYALNGAACATTGSTPQ